MLLISASYFTYAQDKITVTGHITDTNNVPISSVDVQVLYAVQPITTTTNFRGDFKRIVPAAGSFTIKFSHVGYQTLQVNIDPKGETELFVTKMLKRSSTILPSVVIEDQRDRNSTLTRIDPKLTKQIPTITNPVIALVLSSGASTTSEFTSQYNVRGGNFDENLIYVNDIEIFRPLLIRSGQQEGLNFINSDLVSSILFSAGGFESKYGDKISSTLDIRYKKPTEFAGSATFSLLANSIHLEGVAGKKFTYLLGIRQKSNTYLLNSLQTQGNYTNNAEDLQTLLTYSLTPKWELSFLGNISLTKYGLVPTSRETSFGSFDNILKMTMYFEGQEIDRFNSLFGAATATYTPDAKTQMKFIFSGFSSKEKEYYDILGEYFLNQLEIDYNQDDFAKEGALIGIGGYREHARNDLFSRILNFEHKGMHEYQSGVLSWGVKVQNEFIHDKMNEWHLLDSAGYAVPNPPEISGDTNNVPQAVHLQNVIKSMNSTQMTTLSGFVQKDWDFERKNEDIITLTAGIRLNYMDFTKELLPSPRLQLSYKPSKNPNILFRLSTGMYVQPPFYREMRLSYDDTILNLKAGSIYPNAKAQKSIQGVAGMDYFFLAWGRPFKLVSEVYYKYLWDLIPYVVNDVRINYYPDQRSVGYAVGMDSRLSGEFIPGIDSWISMAIMSTKEDIQGDYYYDRTTGEKVEPGYIPRPTDQRFNINVFFQDYLPSFPYIKVNLNLVFGTGLPTGAPNAPKYLQTIRMPAYKRVDIGSAVIIKGDDGLMQKNRLKFFKTITAALEVFNLFNISNVISYAWVADYENYYYAVPNYLTPRRINLKLALEF